MEETLAIGWRLLAAFPPDALTRIRASLVDRYRPAGPDGRGAGSAEAPA
jgi:vacuolar-type H+-ATPase subunit B/Vma2